VVIWRLARKSGVGSTAAAIAALAFVIAPILEPWGFEFRVDVPALALDLAGLWLFCEGLTYSSVALFALSFFTKQNQIAGITAVTLFSVLQGRYKLASVLTMLWVTIVAFAMLLLQCIWPYYLQNMVCGLASILDFWDPIYFVKPVLFAHFAVLVLAVSALFDRTRDLTLITCFFATATMQGFISSLHWGSNAYYFLSFIAATVLLTAGSIEDLCSYVASSSKLAQVWFSCALTFVLLCQREMPLIPAGGLRVLGLSSLLHGHIGCGFSDTEHWDTHVFDLLHHAHGTVLTDEQFLLLQPSVGKVKFIELLFLQSMLQHKLFDDETLLSEIHQRKFGAIALHEQTLDASYRGHLLLWPRLAKAIGENYIFVPGAGPPYMMQPRQDALSQQSGHSLPRPQPCSGTAPGR
jgi:hypothetical protein